jgi:cysteinyl-tRNA synthetase
MFELVRLAQKLLEDSNTTMETISVVDVLFNRLGGDCLGIVKGEYSQVGAVDNLLVDDVVNIVINERNQARSQKDFARADYLRNKLDEIGIVLEDKPEGTTWRTK